MDEGRISYSGKVGQSVDLWIKCTFLTILIVIFSYIFWHLLSVRASVDFRGVLRGGILFDLLMILVSIGVGIVNSEIGKMACLRNQLSLLFIFVAMSATVFLP